MMSGRVEDTPKRVESALPRVVTYRSTQMRTFKACRTCRLQKTRCIGAENPPCRRCRATGRDCVFEELGSSNKSSNCYGSNVAVHHRSGNTRKRSRSPRSLEYEQGNQSLRSYSMDRQHSRSKPSVDGDRSVSLLQRLPSGQISRSPLRSPEPRTDTGVRSLGMPAPDLALLQLDAPITAVHAMSSLTDFPPSPVSVQSKDSSPSCISNTGPFSSETDGMPTSGAPQKYEDIISAGLITESKGRKLFQLYMANANAFLPLFDPATDTFDAMRRHSTFCFTAILAVALRADSPSSDPSWRGERCFQEAQTLAAKSLFTGSPRLETIQGMIVLAANSDRNWFAVSHAYQMSRDIGLWKLLSRDAGHHTADTETRTTGPGNRLLARRMRTALILHHVEQEVAGGTSRSSKGDPVESRVLDGFLRNKASSLSNIRIVSNVEIVQLRGRLLQELEHQNNLPEMIKETVKRLEDDVNGWFDKWDTILQDHDFEVGSFQRSSIRLQRDYAFIIVCGAIISKLSDVPPTQTPPTMTANVCNVMDATLERSVKILGFIADDNDYKWYLQWAPTYSALFPAFTTALAFRLAQLRPHVVDWSLLKSASSAVADILEDYPYRHFSSIIRDFTKLVSSSSLGSQPLAVTNSKVSDADTDIPPERRSAECNDQNKFDDATNQRGLYHRISTALSSVSPGLGRHQIGGSDDSLRSIHTPAEAGDHICASGCNLHDNGKDPDSGSLETTSPMHFDCREGGGYGGCDGDDMDIQQQMMTDTTPQWGALGYAFDFNLFAASVEASMDMADELI